MASFQETLRRLAIFDEGFVKAGFGLDLARTSALDPKTAALLQLGVSVAIGSSAVCLEWSAARALAAGATKDEIADVLLANTWSARRRPSRARARCAISSTRRSLALESSRVRSSTR